MNKSWWLMFIADAAIIALIVAAVCVLVVLLFGCTTALSPSSIDPFIYWPEAEYRINHWLSDNPSCRSGGAVARPVIDGVFERPADGNCFYSPDDRRIYIDPMYRNETRWGMGCMAHELGHAALHQTGNPCWREFEHL